MCNVEDFSPVSDSIRGVLVTLTLLLFSAEMLNPEG